MPLCNATQLQCIKNISKTSTCLPPCSGVIVTSFLKSSSLKNIDHLVSKDVTAYRKYTKWFQFPSNLKGM